MNRRRVKAYSTPPASAPPLKSPVVLAIAGFVITLIAVRPHQAPAAAAPNVEVEVAA
jgi:hypothetical protein